MSRPLPLAAVLASLLAACSHTAPAAGERAEAPAPAEFYPLAVGNRWTYRVSGGGERQVTVEIQREERGVFLDSRGQRLTVDAFGVRDDERYLLRAPLAVGQEWKNVVSVSSIERYRVASVGEPCEVPAGRFDRCVQVVGRVRDPRGPTLANTLTFARGVGLVRVETALEEGERRIPQLSLVLTGYQVQPSPAAH